MKGTFPIDKFRELRTPFYYYDTKVLRDTLSCIRTEASRYDNYSVHYAVKAIANPKVLTIIRASGLAVKSVRQSRLVSQPTRLCLLEWVRQTGR